MSRLTSIRLAQLLGTALAASLLAGCATSGLAVRANSADRAQVALAKGQVAKAIMLTEAAVAASPHDAALRVQLGQAYLKAGRFQSAATTFDDAMKLGDNSARNALSLALAKTGAGDQQGALAVLDDWRGEIPASDLGLALALAGEPERGVAVLADALRGGENTPKLRQNLAYSYALAGRWREARIMAEQDVHGDALGDRMTEWAQTISPEQTQARVAALLGTPLRADSGQPAALALVNNPVQEQLAAQTTADAAAPVVAPALAAPQAAPTTTAQGVSAMQLPAEVPAAAPAVVAQAATAELPAADPAADVANQHNTMLMAAAPQQDRAMFDAVARAPVQPAIPAVLARPREPAIRHMVKAMPTTAQGTHLVQLGSFASPQGARRAWGIYTARNAALSNYRMTISSAKVHGKTFWRVAAGGINGAGAANGLCSQLKSRGGACFAYAIKTRSVVPSTVPGQSFSGPQRARRR